MFSLNTNFSYRISMEQKQQENEKLQKRINAINATIKGLFFVLNKTNTINSQ